ncbi:hypothetical protein D3C80_695140 [compost metagenome]
MATAASTADPPRARTFIPASTASGLAADTKGPRAGVSAVAATDSTAVVPALGVVAHPANINAPTAALVRMSEILRRRFDVRLE